MPTPHTGEPEDAFIQRCMASAESRRSFPDAAQRLAVCHSVYRRRINAKKAFELATVITCQACKGADVPQVEGVIRILDPLLRSELQQLSRDVLRELLRRLDEFSTQVGAADVLALQAAGRRRDEVLAAILASLLLEIEQQYATAIPEEVRQSVRDGVDQLLAAGALFAGHPLSGAQVELTRQVAERELLLLVQGTVLTHREELRTLFEGFLSSANHRVILEGLGAAASSTLAGRAAFETTLASILEPGAALAATVDSWAYRTFTEGGALAGEAAGALGYRAVAIRDGDTTKFCRWVDGRTIPLERVQRQRAAHQEAVLRGDLTGIIAAYPFLDPEIARNGNEYQFERFFRRAGLPPYHFGCRTGAFPDMG